MTGTLQRHRVLFVLLAAAAAFVLATAMSVTTFGTPMSTAFAQEDNGDDNDDNDNDDNGAIEAEAEAEAETEAAPVGGIDAGFGGTAGSDGSAAPIAAAAGLLAAGAAGAVALRRRAIAER
jgi:hypothetical protein